MATDSSLVTLFSWSFTSNNLLSVSLMNDLESKFKRYFCFLNIIPGTKGSDGNRTYSFKDGINFKLEPIKLFELYQTINAYVKGQSHLIGPYGIINDTSKSAFSNGQGGMKTLYVNYKPAEDQNKQPTIFLAAKSGNSSYNVMMPAASALGVAEVLKMIFDRALKIEMDTYQQYSPQAKSNNGSQAPTKSSAKPSEGYANFNDGDAPF